MGFVRKVPIVGRSVTISCSAIECPQPPPPTTSPHYPQELAAVCTGRTETGLVVVIPLFVVMSLLRVGEAHRKMPPSKELYSNTHVHIMSRELIVNESTVGTCEALKHILCTVLYFVRDNYASRKQSNQTGTET